MWFKDWLFYTLVTVVFAVDQIAKEFVRSYIPLYGSWPESGFFRLVHGVNTGSAFGMFSNYTFFLIIGSIIGIGFLLYFFHQKKFTVIWLRLAIGLIVGGASGNLFDRIIFGGVVDFVQVGWWPAFNVADSCISVGMFFFVVIMLFGEKLGLKTNENRNPEIE